MTRPLPERMREAAEVLDEADRRLGRISGEWTRGGLVCHAARFEAEDRAVAEHDAMIEELAEMLAIHVGGLGEDDWEERTKPNIWHDHAGRLIRAGWVKQRPADD